MLSPEFFQLSTGLAGEILQKFTNYHAILAIVGDFSQEQSKPLRDFIYESNKGSHIFFVETEDEAIAWPLRAVFVYFATELLA